MCDHTDTHMEVVISDIVVELSLHRVFDVKYVFTKIVSVMSQGWGRDVINPGFDVIWRGSDVMNAVAVMS